MSGRVHVGRGGHHHLAWESQPLVRSTDRPRPIGLRLVAVAFVAGLLIGLIF